MPSFTKIALALFTLSATVFAGSLEEGDIFHSNGLEKRAIGSDNVNVTPVELEKRAPGGHRRGNNVGHKCKFNSQCYNTAPLVNRAFCSKWRTCDFNCKGGSRRQGNKCVGAPKPKGCKYNANCPKTKVANAHSICSNYKCTFKCLSGWHAVGNKCVKNAHLCGGKSCPHVANGYAICKNGKWIPQCNFYLGFKLYVNKGKYSCINTHWDVNNCGRVGRKCPPGYNGLGHPTCKEGQCGLSCSGYRTRHLPNGRPYCSKI